MFFVFDGVDGAGKSTQLDMFVQWLEEQGRDVVACKDPGSTPLGERIRQVLLGDHEVPISMRAEMMLFTTARTQLIQEVVKPALAKQKTVVLDRYVFSTVVYQGHAGNLDPEEIWQVNRIATQNVFPDVTFILDVPIEVATKRLGSSLDRMESRGNEYFEKVRQGFLDEARRWSEGVDLVDATQPPDEIQADIRKLTTEHMARIEGGSRA